MGQKLTYSIRELSQKIGIGEHKTRTLVKSGKIPGWIPMNYVKKIVISKAQVDAFLAGEKVEDIKARFSAPDKNVITKRRGNRRTSIGERRIAQSRKLFDENPSWDWNKLGEAVGVNPSTLRHIFLRRWGLTLSTRYQEPKAAIQIRTEEAVETTAKQGEDYHLESVADIIASLSNLVKTLRAERDDLQKSLQENKQKIEDITNRGNRLAINLIEAQQLIAEENKRTH